MSKSKLPYDPTNPESIFKYGMLLIGHTLREVAGNLIIENEIRKAANKGGLGQLVEKLHFLYEVNSNSEPDFKEAGLELKVTGLKQLHNKKFVPKERLVCNIINFNEEYQLTFETSTFMQKCAFMFVLFYVYEKGVDYVDMRFRNGILWNIPEKDLLIIEQDWNTIINKIREGKAHEISEGDTTYLGACTKGANNIKSNVTQPFSEELARQRAFSLKASYLKQILEVAEAKHVKIEEVSLVSSKQLKLKKFDEIVKDKFTRYIGLNYEEICKKVGLKKSKAKHKYYIASQAILGVFGKQRIEEFDKADIALKTIRVQRNGFIKESMSFPNIDYLDIINETEWDESFLYDEFTKRFFFVVFKEDENLKDNYQLKGTFFWTMPPQDLKRAEIFWNDTKQKIRENNFTDFFSIKDNKMCHVRPKARNQANQTLAPNGELVDKKSYWLNSNYIKEIIDNEFRD